jgi:TATA-box binding protein (TBP) (component of TFIID and TFIIIB)
MSKSIGKTKHFKVVFDSGKVVTFVGKSKKQIEEVIKSWNLKVKEIRPLT